MVALQWDQGRGIWLLGILAIGAVVLALGDNALHALRYDRAGLAAGQWWRLFTAHAAHADIHHFILNALGLVLVWALFAREYRALEWTVIVLLAALAIGLGLWRFDPQVQWYLGVSGVLHAVMAAGCAKRVFEHRWDRWILGSLLIGKLAFEQYSHWRESAPVPQGLQVIVDAHLYGAVGGALIGAVLCLRMAIIRRHYQER